jgi:hypothetical protein
MFRVPDILRRCHSPPKARQPGIPSQTAVLEMVVEIGDVGVLWRRRYAVCAGATAHGE